MVHTRGATNTNASTAGGTTVGASGTTDGAASTGNGTTGAAGSTGASDQTASSSSTSSGGSGTTSGDATATTTTGGTSVLPVLVTSGPDDYWNTDGAVTEVTTAADLSVDEGTSYQRWDGFGGTFNEMGWDALSVVSSEIEYALTLLFDAEQGANFAFGRIPIGASDYSMSWYTLAETANDYEMVLARLQLESLATLA